MSPTHKTIAIHHVVQILQGAEKRGADIPRLLQVCGISPVLLKSPLSRVSQGQYTALIRRLVRMTRDELWGLCSTPLRRGSFAQGCRLLIHSRTLGEALRAGFRYYHPLLPDLTPRLQVREGVAHVLLQARAERTTQLRYVERTVMFFTLGLACWLVGRRIPLLRVDYSRLDDQQSRVAHRIFQTPVRYQEGHVGFYFDARWLALPIVQTAQSLDAFLRQAPASLLVRYRDQSTVTERIRRILRRHLAGDMPSLEDMGRALAMTPQTLRRRLQEEGQGYQAIKDNLRRDAAIDYLAQPDLTLIDIANRLGFSEPSTFHRAFKKWTGVAPGEYRQSRIADPDRAS